MDGATLSIEPQKLAAWRLSGLMPHPRKSRIVELLVAADPLDARANFYSREQLAAGVARFLFELEKRLLARWAGAGDVGVHSGVDR